jgi:hypothetical protein
VFFKKSFWAGMRTEKSLCLFPYPKTEKRGGRDSVSSSSRRRFNPGGDNAFPARRGHTPTWASVQLRTDCRGRHCGRAPLRRLRRPRCTRVEGTSPGSRDAATSFGRGNRLSRYRPPPDRLENTWSGAGQY